MKSIQLPANLSASQCFQRVFMLTGKAMLARRTSSGAWEFDINESVKEIANAKPLFTHHEVNQLMDVCRHSYSSSKFFWYLTMLIGNFDDQFRFTSGPTYYQHIPLAEAFMCWTYCQVGRN